MLIEDGPPPDAADVAHLGLQLGSALAYLHRERRLHLDLKPSNVIAEAGRAKLIDLSLARPPGPAADGIGTWLYMSPEQARGGVLGPAADVWGLGARPVRRSPPARPPSTTTPTPGPSRRRRAPRRAGAGPLSAARAAGAASPTPSGRCRGGLRDDRRLPRSRARRAPVTGAADGELRGARRAAGGRAALEPPRAHSASR